MRDSFVLFTKIKDVVEALSDEQKGMLFQAILDYESDKEVNITDAVVKVAFIPIKRDLDYNEDKWNEEKSKRSEAGKKGAESRWGKKEDMADDSTPIANNGNAINANGENGNAITDDSTACQDIAKMADYVYVYVNDNENVINNNPLTPLQGEQPKPKKKATDLIAERKFSDRLRTAVEEWIKYKIEKRQGYKETGLKSFLSQVEKKVSEHGEDAVISVINSSMSANYQGVVWDWLQKKSPPKVATDWNNIT